MSGGCGILTIKWARSVLANGNQLLVEIKNTEGSVLKSETYVKEDSEQHVMNETTFNMNVAGTFKIVISNQNYVANDSADGIIQGDDINRLDRGSETERHCKSGPKSPDSGPLPHYSFCILVVLFSFRLAETADCNHIQVSTNFQ